MLDSDALCHYTLDNAQLVADGRDLDIPGAQNMQFAMAAPVQAPPSPQPPPPLQEQFEDDEDDDDDNQDFQGCVGCLFGERRYDKVKAPKFSMMNQLLDNTLFVIPNEAMARSIAAFYRNEIYDPIMNSGGLAPPWSWRAILTHITEHMRKNPDVFIGASTELMDELEQKARKLTERAYAEGDADEFRKSARILILANKRNEDLRQLNPKKMWGWCESGFHYDTTAGAKLMNLSRITIT